MLTKEEITKRLDRLFEDLEIYPQSQSIADAINENLELLAEFESEGCDD